MSLFNPYALLGIALLVLSAYGGGRLQQRIYDAAGYQKKLDAIELETQKRLLKAQEASTVVVTQYVKEKGDVIRLYNERVVYLPAPAVVAAADAACAVPNFFVELWNTANKGVLPDPVKGVDAGRSAVVLSDVDAQHERESKACLLKELQLKKVKDWIRTQCLAINGAPC